MILLRDCTILYFIIALLRWKVKQMPLKTPSMFPNCNDRGRGAVLRGAPCPMPTTQRHSKLRVAAFHLSTALLSFEQYPNSASVAGLHSPAGSPEGRALWWGLGAKPLSRRQPTNPKIYKRSDPSHETAFSPRSGLCRGIDAAAGGAGAAAPAGGNATAAGNKPSGSFHRAFGNCGKSA